MIKWKRWSETFAKHRNRAQRANWKPRNRKHIDIARLKARHRGPRIKKERKAETGSARSGTLTEDRFRDACRRKRGAFIIFAECEATSSFALKRRDIRRPVFCPWYLGEVVVAEARGRPETLPPTFACPTSSKGLSEKNTASKENGDGVPRERERERKIEREEKRKEEGTTCVAASLRSNNKSSKTAYNSTEIFLSRYNTVQSINRANIHKSWYVRWTRSKYHCKKWSISSRFIVEWGLGGLSLEK